MVGEAGGLVLPGLVCGPTAKMGMSRRAVRRTRARMPLALVTRIACTPVKVGFRPGFEMGRQQRRQQRHMAQSAQAGRDL
jgi:hypothetical protein